MSERWSDCVPNEHRQTASEVLTAAFGGSKVSGLEPVLGGASGALTFRADVDGRFYLLRLETRMSSPLRNPHQYVCLQTAAEAGIAPAVHYLDAGAGAVVMDFVAGRPLSEYPGGPADLARAVGELVRRLQQSPAFPELHEFPAVVRRMIGFLRGSGVFVEGLLDPHAEGLDRIVEAYRWEPSTLVSSHNDPNPQNILFDGERLWLIDWEAAYRNDPLVDVAIVAENLAPTSELESALVEAWLGHAPDDLLRARLRLMRLLTRMYYAGLLIALSARSPGAGPETDLAAPTPAEFASAFASGEHKPTSSETMRVLAKMCLAGFLTGIRTPGFEESLALARQG